MPSLLQNHSAAVWLVKRLARHVAGNMGSAHLSEEADRAEQDLVEALLGFALHEYCICPRGVEVQLPALQGVPDLRIHSLSSGRTAASCLPEVAMQWVSRMQTVHAASAH